MCDESVIRTLLIDDDEYHAFLVREYLKGVTGSTISVDWADSYEKGRTLLRESRHDAVLLDYLLGSSTGIDLLDELPDITSRVPVILLTGHMDQNVDRQALERGAFDFLEKDEINPAILERTIRYAVKHFSVQQALRESKDRFEGLYNAVFEGILVHDGTTALHANPPLLELLGRSRDEVIGCPLDEVFPHVLVPFLAGPVCADKASVELRTEKQSGESLILEVRTRPHTFNGHPAFLLAVRDITERKRTEEEILRQNEELEERVIQRTDALRRSNQDLERFAHVIAHDIRVPLHTVRDYVREARNKMNGSGNQPEGDLERHFLDRAIETVEHLQELVDAVLDYSRISMQDSPIVRIDLNRLVREVLIHLDTELTKVGAEVSVDGLPAVEGNPMLLGAVFRNLVHNAIKYRSDRPLRIAVLARERDGQWEITVCDNGLGFRPDEAESLFIVLHRGENAAQCPGDGIGLAMCKKIVEMHGGRIWADAQLGVGAAFSFTLPKPALDDGAEAIIQECGHEDHSCR